jgi:hypothetical protein
MLLQLSHSSINASTKVPNSLNILIQGYNAIFIVIIIQIVVMLMFVVKNMAAIHNQWLFNDDLINQIVENANTSGVISKKL